METTQPNIQSKAQDLQDRIAPQIEDVRRNLADVNTRVSSFIRERPGTCLLGALALGYVVGKLASRR